MNDNVIYSIRLVADFVLLCMHIYALVKPKEEPRVWYWGGYAWHVAWGVFSFIYLLITMHKLNLI